MAASKPQESRLDNSSGHEVNRTNGAHVGTARRPPGRAARTSGGSSAHAQVATTVGAAIVPHLVLTGRCVEHEQRRATSAADNELIAALVERALTERPASVVTFLEDLCASGRSVEALYLDLLAPAVRHLKASLAADRCTPPESVLALSSLLHALHAFAPSLYREVTGAAGGRRVLWTSLPQQDAGTEALFDSFDVAITAEFFRAAGWDVWADTFRSDDALVATVRDRQFAIVGLYIREPYDAETVGRVVRLIRKASKGHSPGVLLGGTVFRAHPEWAVTVGADAAVADARHAVAQAAELV